VDETLRGEWQAFCDELASAGAILDGDRADDPATQAAGLRYLLHLVSSGLDLFVHDADPAHPEVCRPQDPDKRWGLDCPDAHYGRAPLDGTGTYRITGGPGDAHYLGITVTAGHLGTQGIRTIGSLSRPGDLACEPDGSFELVVGPDEHPGNWIRTEPDAEAVSFRQFLYDWDRETPSWITIERLDAAGPPVPDPATETDRLRALGGFVAGSAKLWDDYVDGLRRDVCNTLGAPKPPSSRYGATPDNVYGSGYFELAPDEAVIIEVTPPACHYWQFQVGNRWFESLDYTYRQTSLNGHQAVLDADGVFRAVLAHVDPGVANWLDAAGSPVLPMAYRYQLPTVAFDELPRPSSRVVRLADLDRELDPATPLITPEARADALARRRRAVLRRYRR
jgi:hypothetical protein